MKNLGVGIVEVRLLFFLIHFGLETKIGMFWTSCLEPSDRTQVNGPWTSTIYPNSVVGIGSTRELTL